MTKPLMMGLATLLFFLALPIGQTAFAQGAQIETSASTVETPKRVFELYPRWRGHGETLHTSEKPEDLYYVRLRDNGKGVWTVTEVTYRESVPPRPLEEVLLVSAKLGVYHPDWERDKKGYAKIERICTASEEKRGQPYRICNSAFAALPLSNAIFGFIGQSHPNAAAGEYRSNYKFSEENLKKAMSQIDFDTQLRVAEAEGAVYWKEVAAKAAEEAKVSSAAFAAAMRERESQRIASLQRDNARLAQEDAYYVRISKYPVGFKDSCHTPDGYRDITPPADPKLVCQNIGAISSLERLKESGYIVTNVSRLGGDGNTYAGRGTTWQFSVERYTLPK